MMSTESSLFTDLNSEETVSLSGGGRRHNSSKHNSSPGYFNLQSYIFGLGAGVLFGNPGLTADEIQYVWENSLSL